MDLKYNDTQETATNLGELLPSGYVASSWDNNNNFIIYDTTGDGYRTADQADWFKFTVPYGVSKLKVSIDVMGLSDNSFADYFVGFGYYPSPTRGDLSGSEGRGYLLDLYESLGRDITPTGAVGVFEVEPGEYWLRAAVRAEESSDDGWTSQVTEANYVLTVDIAEHETQQSFSGVTTRSSRSQTLSSNAANLVLTGKANISGTGNANDNTLVGNSGRNTLAGKSGADTLAGRGGADTILGGAGDDIITGGTGTDRLYGGDGKRGLGNDVFVFTSRADSAAGKGQDTIYDFGKGDRIALSSMDSDMWRKGDQDFTFIGDARFHGKAGELRFEKLKSDTYIYADLDGDRRAEFAIHLDNAVKLVKAEFLL